jgi:hypothetical protein
MNGEETVNKDKPDMEHLAIFKALARELFDAAWNLNEIRIDRTDKQELCDAYLVQIDAIIDALKQQRRALRYMNGTQVEPQTHFASAIIHGSMGGPA